MYYVETAAMEGPPDTGRGSVFPGRWGTPPAGAGAIAVWARSHILAEQRTARAKHLARRLLDADNDRPTTGEEAQALLLRRYRAA